MLLNFPGGLSIDGSLKFTSLVMNLAGNNQCRIKGTVASGEKIDIVIWKYNPHVDCFSYITDIYGTEQISGKEISVVLKFLPLKNRAAITGKYGETKLDKSFNNVSEIRDYIIGLITNEHNIGRKTL